MGPNKKKRKKRRIQIIFVSWFRRLEKFCYPYVKWFSLCFEAESPAILIRKPIAPKLHLCRMGFRKHNNICVT